MFHVPPQSNWNAGSIQRSLQQRGLNARVDGEDVVLEFPRTGRYRHLLRLLDLFALSARLTITIEHCYDRKIGNVSLCCHPNAPLGVALPHVEEVMRNHGFVQVGTKATVRQIAASMSVECSELQAALDDYDFHQSKYNPESANEWSGKRDLLLARIETLLANVAPQ